MESNRGSSKRLRLGRGRVLVASAFAASLAVLIVGCGGEKADQTSSSSGSGQLVVASTAPAEAAHGTSQAGSAAPSGEGIAVTSADALPPDVAATVADTLVDAGGSVEVTAEGSPDVVGVTLSDGIGKQQPFVYEAASDTWKVFYRVPIKPGTDRLALSVTGKSASQRWRRVWLFLTVAHDTPEAATDSSSKP